MLTDHCGLQVDHDGPGHVLPIAGLAEERGEGVIVMDLAGLRTKGAIGLDAMLQAVALPADITDLDTNLAKVDGDAVIHGGYRSAGTGSRSRHQVTVAIPNKLRAEVSNALSQCFSK